MKHEYEIGQKVVITSGPERGKEGEILERQPALVYKVKILDKIVFYSQASLQACKLLTIG
jgi:ribosomal protein L24